MKLVTEEKVFVSFKKNVPKVDTKEQKDKQDQQKGKQQQKGEQKGQQQKGQQQKGAQKGAAQPAKVEKPDDIYRCDFRVGKIIEVENHPDAQTLYKEIIDFVSRLHAKLYSSVKREKRSQEPLSVVW